MATITIVLQTWLICIVFIVYSAFVCSIAIAVGKVKEWLDEKIFR